MITPLEKPYYDLEEVVRKLETEHNLIYSVSDILEYARLDNITLCACINVWQELRKPILITDSDGEVRSKVLIELALDPI